MAETLHLVGQSKLVSKVRAGAKASRKSMKTLDEIV
jgi:hypothetical protein